MRAKRLLLGLAVMFGLLLAVRAVIRSQTGAARHPTSAAQPVRATVDPSIGPGAPNTPRSALYRFATAYGEVSRATVTARDRLLVSLAASPLRSQLRGPQGALTATSSVLRQIRLDSLLVSVRVQAPADGVANGTVVLDQWPVGPGASTVAPTQSAYTADLVRVDGSWRVSEFELAP